MITLVTTTREARVVIKYGAICIAAFLLLFWAVRFLFFIGDILFNPNRGGPDMKYGVLTLPNFKTKQSQIVTYKINTITGELPTFADRIKVYKLISQRTDVFSLERARRNLEDLGYANNEKKIDELLYQWKDSQDAERVITYNILTNDFDISSNYLFNGNELPAGELPQNEDMISLVYDFLSSLGDDLSDIDKGKTFVSYFKVNNSILTPAESFSQAQVARVVLYQQNVDNLPILYKNAVTSDMKFYFAKIGFSAKIIDAYFKHRKVDTNDFGVYYAKSPAVALEDLKKGNAIILENNAAPEITITNIFQAYYLGEETSDYLMPIIVFEGINFKAYVEGVRTDIVNKK